MSTPNRAQLERSLQNVEHDLAHGEGQVSQLLKQLKQDFSCKTKEEGEEKLEAIREEIPELKEAYEKKVKAFLKKYPDAPR